MDLTQYYWCRKGGHIWPLPIPQPFSPGRLSKHKNCAECLKPHVPVVGDALLERGTGKDDSWRKEALRKLDILEGKPTRKKKKCPAKTSALKTSSS